MAVGDGLLCDAPDTVSLSLEALETGTELFAVELTVTFDPAVISVDAVRPGSLTSGWSVVSNQPAAGTLRLALAGAQPVTAIGEFAQLDLGPVATGTTALTITASLLNEGRVVTTTVPGQAVVGTVPTPTITGPTESCAGESVTLDAGAGYSTYLWSPGGQTTQTIEVSPAATTSYTVTVTTAAGCAGTSASHSVTVNPLPTPVISGPTETCAGESVTLDAGAGYASYLWSPGGQTTQTIVVSPAATTTYTVTVIGSNGCAGTSPAHTVVVHPSPQPDIVGRGLLCQGEMTSLDAGAGYASHLWSTGETTRLILVTPMVTTTYSVTVTTPEGCEGTSPEHVVVVSDTCDPILIDGFESGTTAAWSGWVP